MKSESKHNFISSENYKLAIIVPARIMDMMEVRNKSCWKKRCFNEKIIFFSQNASIKIEVINKLEKIENINFNFIQKINEKKDYFLCYFDKKGKILV